MTISPKIEIDHSRCTVPFDCKRCVLACEPSVFSIGPVRTYREKEVDKKEPGSYRLRVAWRDVCTGCMECVQVCPVNALTVRMPEEGK